MLAAYAFDRWHAVGPLVIWLHTHLATQIRQEPQDMELAIIMLFFLSLAILAPRFGYDSTDRLNSEAGESATHGLHWAD